MAVKLYSKINPNQILHSIINIEEVDSERVDLTNHDCFLQASIIRPSFKKKVPPHFHNPKLSKEEKTYITQESWVVFRGSIDIELFDLDNTLLYSTKLVSGHILVTFYGGHSLICNEINTLFLEFKNGPYLGRDFTII
jgi:hypothetical protein